MPIELPNLDDRRFADLTDEGRQMIAALAPSWTDHHPSDPGMTLMELFAAVTEQLIYRTNRVTVAHKEVFLSLLDPSGTRRDPRKDIDGALASAVADTRIESRAVTARDYESLARAAGAAAARCLPRCKPVYRDGKVVEIRNDEVGHLSLVVIEAQPASDQLWDELANKLRPVLTTELVDPRPRANDRRKTLHIVPAQPLPVTVAVKLACFAEYRADAQGRVGQVVSQSLAQYFDCRTGGPAGTGWSLGQPVYKSALYAVIVRLPGVDYIESLELSVEGAAERRSGDGVLPACYEYVEITTVCNFSHEPER